MTSTLHPVHVRIKSFQSIEDVEFEVRGFTCITGKTNIGKSAIMRAISRSLLNDPVTGMVRKGAKYSSVEMQSEGWGFLWEKGEKDVNRYQIGGKTYDKTGQNQLPEVEAMGFRSIRIGDDDLEPWWATQTRPMFLLDKSGPQITNFISEVSRLQVYQNAIVLAARSKRKCTDESRTKSEELGRIQDRLNKLSGLESVERLESEIEEQIASLQEYAQRAITLEQLHKDLERVADLLRRSKAASDLKVKANLTDVESAVSRSVRVAKAKFRLDRTVQKIISLKPIDSVSVPELPDVERLRKLRRCMRLVPMRSFIDRSAAVQKSKMKVPDLSSIGESVSRVRQLSRLHAGLVRGRKAAARVDALPEVPKLPEAEVLRLRKLVLCAQKLRELKSAVDGADAELSRLQGVKKALDKKMAAIQVCSECGQKLPSSEEHTHAKRKRALTA